MKKITFLLAALLLVTSVESFAQTFFNNTSCNVTIRKVCYTANCPPSNINNNFTVDVLAGDDVLLSTLDDSHCTTGQKVLYEVCWINACSSQCQIVTDNTTGHCTPPFYPTQSLICGMCGTGTPPNFLWSGGNLYLQ